jgi:type IV secretion system protein VirB10
MKTRKVLAAAASILALGWAPALLAQEPAGPATPPPPATVQSQQKVDPSSASSSQPPAATVAATAPASAKPEAKIALPAGTHIPLVLHNAVSTRSSQVGDPVYFETSFPVLLNGKIIVPAGSWVSGEVTELKRAGRVKGRAELMVRLTTMILPNAYVVSLTASPSNAGTGGHETTDREGKVIGDTDKASDAGTVMKTTAAGAGIGALASRTATGAGIGAGVGAATGLAAVLLTRGPDAELPRGTTLDAVLDHTILLDADKVQFTSPGQASALPGPPNRAPQRMAVPF